MAKSLVFVDRQVSDYRKLLAGLAEDTEIYLLDPDRDGLTQMADFLAGRSGFDSIQIISHGSQGALSLGNATLSHDNLPAYREQLARIGQALTETGDILLYGCNVAQCKAGEDFIAQLADLTGAEVAASIDLTGALDRGGDWELEAATGPIETVVLSAPDYHGLLGLSISPALSSSEFRNSNAFAALRADGSVVTWGGWGGDSSNVAAALDGSIDVIQVFSTGNDFAALRADGSVVTWGLNVCNSSSVVAAINGNIDVTQVFSNSAAFAALRADGSVVTWGGWGGDSSNVAAALDGTIDVTQVFSNSEAFAALRADGSVVTWGAAYNGGDSSSVAAALDGTIDVNQVFSNGSAFAALRADGSVVTWGDTNYGGDSSSVAAEFNGSIDVTQVFAVGGAFTALRADGTVVTWGSPDYAQDSSGLAAALNGAIGVTQVFSNIYAVAALRADGSVVTWGDAAYGGDSSSVAASLDGTIDVTQVFSSNSAFAALRADGSVVTWGGGDSSSVAAALNGTIDVTQVFTAGGAFAALRADGSVVTWGAYGGNSSVAAALDGTIDVTRVFSTTYAFAALRADGSVVTWGEEGSGGDSYFVAAALNGTIDVTQIYATDYAFAALRADGTVVTWGDAVYGAADSSDVADQLINVVGLANPYVNDVYLTDETDTTPPTVTGLSPEDDANSVPVTSNIIVSFSEAIERGTGSIVLKTDAGVPVATYNAAGSGNLSISGNTLVINPTVDLAYSTGYQVEFVAGVVKDLAGNSYAGTTSFHFSTAAPGYDGPLGLTITPSPSSYPGKSSGEYRNDYAFAALRGDGSVVTWGDAHYGGDSSSVAASLDGTIDVTQVFSSTSAFAALRADGSVVTWGYANGGGDSSNVAAALNGNIDVMQVFSTGGAFAALRADGSVVTWGVSFNEGYGGGNSSSVAAALDGTIDVTHVVSASSAFAALRTDGSVVTWGGGDSSSIAAALNGSIKVTQLFSNEDAFAALRADGSVITWGGWGGNSSSVAAALNGNIDVTQVFSTAKAFAALRVDGSVVTWGMSDSLNYGGDSSSVAAALNGSIDVTQVFSTEYAFAALRSDGSVVTWGYANYGGDSNYLAAKLNGSIDVTQVFSTAKAFAALRADGSVVTWGSADYGGSSSQVAAKLNGDIDVIKIFSTDTSFAALRADGSVVTWGGLYNESLTEAAALDGTIDVTQIFSTSEAFAALRADGSVVNWGKYSKYGGDSSAVASQLYNVVSMANPYTNDVYHNYATSLSLSTADAALNEGNSGSTAFTFMVWRMGDTSQISTVHWSVAGSGTKPANSTDFVGNVLPSGTVSFAVGETSKAITINVQGDTGIEPDENFTVTLANPLNGNLGNLDSSTAVGTIRDDDGDDYSGSTSTAGIVAVGGSAVGNISIAGDQDWFAAYLYAGHTYRIKLTGASSGGGTLSDPLLASIFTADGTALPNTSDNDSGLGTDSQLDFTPTSSGNYYLAAGGYNSATGTFTVSLTDSATSPVPGLTITALPISCPGKSSYERRHGDAFAALRADGSVVTWGYAADGGNSSSVAAALDGTLDVTQVFSSFSSFAALRVDGSVVSWGNAANGGDSSSVALALNGSIDVTQVFSANYAFAALRADGSVVTWGAASSGGDSSSVAPALNGSIDVTHVFSTFLAFAALRADGSVVTWGDAAYGGDSSSVAAALNGTINVTQVFVARGAFAALRSDGSVVSWGNTVEGGDSSSVATALNGSVDVTQVFSNIYAFAALRADGSVVTWGDAAHGGDSSSVATALNGSIDVTQVFSDRGAFAALRADGSVVTWGVAPEGGDSSTVAAALDGVIDVKQVFSTGYAFAALRADGSVVTWGDAAKGGDSSSVAAALDGSNDVKQVFSTELAFAALRADGSVITWGDAAYGGNSSSVAAALDGTIDVIQVFTTYGSFSALRADGSVVTWGYASWGGDSSSVAGQLTNVVSMANFSTNDVYLEPDTAPPTHAGSTPTDVAIDSNIVITFNEKIQRGTGSIILKNAAGATVATYNAAVSGNLTISGNTLTIDPTDDLASGTGYTFEFESGSITDLAGNSSAGTTRYNFTAADIIPPTVTSFCPADEATGVSVDSNIVITFSEEIRRGSGNILLKTGAGTTVATYNAANSPNLTISGNTLTVNPSEDLALGTGYKVELFAGNIRDLDGNAYAGTGTYNFTTYAPPDITPPTVTKFSPADEVIGVAVDSNIVVTFSEAISRGTGNILIRTAGGLIVANYDAATSSNLTISGNTLTINPTDDFASSTGYTIEFVTGSIRDLAGNSYAGTTSYNFTSAASLLGLSISPLSHSYPGSSSGESINWQAFAALRADGSVVTWGDNAYGGDSSSVATALNGTIDVTQIYSTGMAFAALRSDGSVVTWGSYYYGGDSSGMAALDGTIDVTQVFSSAGGAFAALRVDGSVVTWGQFGSGTSSVAAALNGSIDVTQVFSNSGAFAALRADGSVVTWGYDFSGGDSSPAAAALDGTIDITRVFSTNNAFAALRADGSVVTWGNTYRGGDSSSVVAALNGTIDVSQVFSTEGAFAALRGDGSVVTWGFAEEGGDSHSVAAALNGTIDVTQVFSTTYAFAALRADGSVVTWGDVYRGGDSSSVAAALNGTIDVTQVCSTGEAFAALRVDGSVVTWGNASSGGDSTDLAADINGHISVTQIFSTGCAFAALRADGSVVTWGDVSSGGDSSYVASQLTNVVSMANPYTDDVYLVPGTTPPTVTVFSPADEATGVAVGSNIVVIFNEAIQRGTGNIVFKTAADVTVATYNVASSTNLSISGNTLTINPSADLALGTGYQVEFGAGTIKNLAGNSYGGTTSYNFTTGMVPDTTAPTVSSFSPADQVNGIDICSNLVVTFSEAIQRSTGNILLKTAGGVTVATYNAASSSNLTISGNTLTIDPTAELLPASTYQVEIAAGAIQDLAGNAYAGTTTYNFTTAIYTSYPGTPGSDTFTGGVNNDLMDGGAGLDNALFSGNRQGYTIAATAGGCTLAGEGWGADTLTSVERLHFADVNLAWDIDGSAGQVYRLYQAAFDRTPDLSGLGGWIGGMDGGMTLLQVAAAFVGSAEFQSLYGANPSNEQFITQLYLNVLNRAPDPGGFGYWVDQLARSLQSRAEVLVFFSESGENQAAVLPAIGGGILYASAEQAAGLARGQNFEGSTLVDILIGTVGNDTFLGGAGDDSFDGGVGIDSAIYEGSRAGHIITRTSGGLTVSGGSDGTDTLLNVERLKFADSALAFDIDGNAGQTYRLYQAAFARTPDTAGLSDWIRGMDSGMTLQNVATGFIGSGEFQGLYGASPTNTEFINLLYNNVLHRAPDQAGYDYWSDQIEHGMSREQVLVGFSESQENQLALLGVIQDGIAYIPA